MRLSTLRRNLKGATENSMMGLLAPVGTGNMDLLHDGKKVMHEAVEVVVDDLAATRTWEWLVVLEELHRALQLPSLRVHWLVKVAQLHHLCETPPFVQLQKPLYPSKSLERHLLTW
jgi:hypothetical protein